MPLRLLPQSPYVTPSPKSSTGAQQPEFGLTCCPVRPFAPLRVCTKDLTADIFHGWVIGTSRRKKTAGLAPGGFGKEPGLNYFSFISLYSTCLRALGSNFMISIFSGIVFLFLVVV